MPLPADLPPDGPLTPPLPLPPPNRPPNILPTPPVTAPITFAPVNNASNPAPIFTPRPALSHILERPSPIFLLTISPMVSVPSPPSILDIAPTNPKVLISVPNAFTSIHAFFNDSIKLSIFCLNSSVFRYNTNFLAFSPISSIFSLNPPTPCLNPSSLATPIK